jgi:transcriptional regulator with XRE-family HTH domain
MNDLQLGLALRATRIKRRLRQCDLARQAGVSASVVSRLEHGDMSHVSLPALRGVAEKLGVSLEFLARSSGGDLDRVVSARHAALGERVAAWIACQPGWRGVGEVSFSIYGERGIVDLLAWHDATGSIVVIELKTAIVDVDELIGTLDRKRRLATRIAADRGWTARSVSSWLIVGDSRTNRRRVAEHRNLLDSALPRDGRSLATVFRQPERGLESGIAFWPNLPGAGVRREIASRQRVVKRNPSVGGAPHARVLVQQVVADRL